MKIDELYREFDGRMDKIEKAYAAHQAAEKERILMRNKRSAEKALIEKRKERRTNITLTIITIIIALMGLIQSVKAFGG